MPSQKSKPHAKKPTPNPVPPVDAALLAEMARTLDLELDWYFTYGESAAARGTLSMLPSHLAGRVLGSDPEAATARLAIDLEHEVKSTLNRLTCRHGGALRAVYSPRAWPAVLTREYKKLTPIAVRLFCASQPWPACKARQGFETAAARALADALATKRKPLALKRAARRVLGNAIKAYAAARAAAR